MSLQPGTSSLTAPQPQVAQLELTFAGPLVKDSYVANKNVLPTLPLTTNYEQKLVWVKADKAWYYLSSGDGSLLSHWTLLVGRMTIEAYDPSNSSGYTAGDTVYQNGIIYKAIQDAPQGTAPTNGAYWLIIAGDGVAYRFIFQNVTSFAVVTPVKNPLFETIIGDIQMDGSDFVIGDDGMVEILNQEIVHAFVVKDDSVSGKYNVYFEENGTPFAMSGAINVK
jgi:hypothetical protein